MACRFRPVDRNASAVLHIKKHLFSRARGDKNSEAPASTATRWMLLSGRTSCSPPFRARQVRMRRSSVRRTPAPISGCRRRISSKMGLAAAPERF
jgi:hypothetical protein